MPSPQVEYVGFTVAGLTREYLLRVRQPGGDAHDVTLSIPNEAFLAGRVRYQDAPEICFLRIQRELTEAAGGLPAAHLKVNDAELQAYREAHTHKPPTRRPRPPLPA
jgi:hypothetical protein